MKDILQNFREKWLQQPRRVLGVMTGTSFDGIDLALAEISFENQMLQFQPVSHTMVEYPNELRNYFTRITSQNQTSLSELSTFNFLHPHCIADAISTFLKSLPTTNIDLIGYHGQTIWHQPIPLLIGKLSIASTIQLGSSSVLAQKTSIPVVSDFRSADMVFGGQGTPLVPIFDRDIFSESDQTAVLVNIGGIANISILQPNSDFVIAYDVGPGNVWIDYICKKHFQKNYDESGSFAKSGELQPILWEQLLEIPYLNKPYPKSTGREEFSVAYLESILKDLLFTPEDVLHTLCAFTAYCIASEINIHSTNSNIVYVSGGGLHNSVIMNYLRSFLPHSNFSTTETKGIPSDAKEALCFAYLAWRVVAGLPISIPTITGSTKETISGSISFPI